MIDDILGEPKRPATPIETEAHDQLNSLLRELLSIHGSDLHLQVGRPPTLRLDGKLLHGTLPPVGADDLRRMVFSIMNDEQRERFRENLELDLSYELEEEARFRVNVFIQREQIGAAFRLIPIRVGTIDDWGLPQILKKLSFQPRGFILITGPTGSGKSTTLAAMIEHVNLTAHKHIITIEDPIEFAFLDKKSIIEQREVGVDTHSFADALRHIMRQNPDVIMVGELRDLETIDLALQAAEMGSLVMATLHTRTAYQTVDRVIDVFPSEQQAQVRLQLATSLSAVISQTLVPHASGAGRKSAFEIMVCNDAIRNAIREGKPQQIPSLIQAGSQYGMKLMDKALQEMVVARDVKYEDVIHKVADPKRFEELAGFYKGI